MGHRVDAIKRDPKVSFCVYGQDELEEGDWAYHVKSVVVFGKARIVEDYEEMAAVSRKICEKFPVPEGYADREIAKDGPATLCISIEIESMTGKLVHEA